MSAAELSVPIFFPSTPPLLFLLFFASQVYGGGEKGGVERVGVGEVVGGGQIYPFVGRWVLGGRVQLAAGKQDDLVGLVGFA